MSWPTFLSPWLGGIAAAIAIPTLILLYFLKLRRRNMDVSTTLLWKRAVEDLQANAPFQKLRNNILLILQLIALILVLLALAQPVLDSSAPPPPRSIIMIDRSASMGAVDETGADGEPESRIDRAKRQATAFVESMSGGAGVGALGEVFGGRGADEAMVIAFDGTAEVIQPFTSSKALLIEAIALISAGESTTLIEPAAKTAEPYAAARTAGEGENTTLVAGVPIVLWSDGGLTDQASAQLPNGLTIDYRRVGAENTPNIAITSMQAQRVFGKPDEIGVFVAVQSTDTQDRDVDVEFGVDGLAARVRRVTIPGVNNEGQPGVGGVVFNLTRSDGAVLSASLVMGDDEADALEADNYAWATLAPARRMTVATVGPTGFFTKNALRSMPLAGLDELTTEEFAKELREAPGTHEVYVVNAWPEEGLPDGPPRGRFLCLGAIPPGAAITEAAPDDEVSAFVNWRRDHPALRYVDLDPTRLMGLPRFEAGDGTRVLGTTSSGPAIFEIDRAGTRAIVLGFDPGASTWPGEWSFPLFVAQAVRYLGDDLSELASPVARPGDVVRTRVPVGVTSVRHSTPDGEERTLTVGPDNTVVVGPIETTGIHALSWEGAPGVQDTQVNGRAVRLIACSMLDSVESQLGVADTLDLSRASVRTSTATGDGADEPKELWPLLVALALAVVLFEWYVYNRKVRL